MTLEEYKSKLEKNPDWTPGWDAIWEIMSNLYKDNQPICYQSELPVRYGGKDYLDGFCIYKSEKGVEHNHIISYGMSALIADPVYFGKEYSSWGYEMTMRIKISPNDKCLWAMNMIANLATYTNSIDEGWLEAEQFIEGSDDSINLDVKSKITALITVVDPELPPIDTIHGSLEFIQLVGITADELKFVQESEKNTQILISNMKKENPYFITDLSRTQNYI